MSAHVPGKLVAVVKSESVLAETKDMSSGRSINVRWIYDEHVTLACGCVVVYSRSTGRHSRRKRCHGVAVAK